MKIIQSFAQFDEGSYYMKNDRSGKDTTYLNFYSMLLSVLTLQKYYGKVTMYCNQKAHDTFIKYLPYGEIKIVENDNPFNFWSYYKVDVIKMQRSKKFIHVDPDVFIFDKLFDEFVEKDDIDILVQDTIPPYINPCRTEINIVENYLKSVGDANYKHCDGKAFSNGVVGITQDVKKEFVALAEILKNGYLSGDMEVNSDLIAMIAEELALYLVAKQQKSRVHEILPYDEVLKDGSRKSANERKFTHMWGETKFNDHYIEVIKLKTKKEFPLYSDLIDQYDNEVIDKVMV